MARGKEPCDGAGESGCSVRRKGPNDGTGSP